MTTMLHHFGNNSTARINAGTSANQDYVEMLLFQIPTVCFLMLQFPICCFDNLAQKHSYGLEKFFVFCFFLPQNILFCCCKQS